MDLQKLVAFGQVIYPFIAGAIVVICALLAGYGFYVMANVLIDRYQGHVRRNRHMATSMPPDEILMKRLQRAVKRKSETMRVAGRI